MMMSFFVAAFENRHVHVANKQNIRELLPLVQLFAWHETHANPFANRFSFFILQRFITSKMTYRERAHW